MFTYYFDIDGVMNIFDKSTWSDDWDKRPINHLGSHYLRNLEVEHRLHVIIQYLYTKYLEGTKEIFLLSTVTRDPLLAIEHYHDHMSWLQKYYSYFPHDKIILALNELSKVETIRIVQQKKLTRRDILIDDYNKNLIEWEKAGGTPIKFINNLNSESSFNGIKITQKMSINTILDLFEEIEDEISNHKRLPLLSNTQMIDVMPSSLKPIVNQGGKI